MLAIADHADLDHGPRTKSGTERMCAVTRQVAGVDDLIRFVLSPAGEIVPDLKRKLPGRGLWVSLSHATVTEAARRNVFARSFKREVQVSKTLADDVERLMVRSASEALAMAAIPRPEGSARASRPAALLQAVLEEAERASRAVDRTRVSSWNPSSRGISTSDTRASKRSSAQSISHAAWPSGATATS